MTSVGKRTVNGGLPFALMMPLNVALLPFTVKPLENVGVPLKVGEPLKVPANEPPPPRTLGPSEVKPTLKFTGPLKFDVACQVFVPVRVVHYSRKTRHDDGLMPSSTPDLVFTSKQFNPFEATSCQDGRPRRAARCHSWGARKTAAQSGLGVRDAACKICKCCQRSRCTTLE